jgi:hypothetical protein
MLGNSLVAEQLVASQEGLGFMELVYILLPTGRICRRCEERKVPVIIREMETETCQV